MAKVTVDKEKCIGCGACVGACPNNVLELVDGKAEPTKMDACNATKACTAICPVGAITVEE